MQAHKFTDAANLNSVKHCKSNVIQPPDMNPIYSTFDERKTRVFLDTIDSKIKNLKSYKRGNIRDDRKEIPAGLSYESIFETGVRHALSTKQFKKFSDLAMRLLYRCFDQMDTKNVSKSKTNSKKIKKNVWT